MATTTPQQLFPIPSEGDLPDVPVDLAALANAIEKRVAGVYNSTSDRSTKITSPQEGQVAYLKDTNTWTFYDGSAWQPMFAAVPTFSSGSTVPSSGSGNNGDVFFKV